MRIQLFQELKQAHRAEKKYKAWGTIACLVFLVYVSGLFSGCQTDQEIQLERAPEQSLESQSETESPLELVVYICGAVKNPGVYSLPQGARVDQAVNLAGGFTKKADPTGINLAKPVEDGMQVLIPKKGEALKETSKDSGGTEAKVNLNTASREELMEIPGIGEAKADAILAYREEKGAFGKTEDVMKVSGIKEGAYNKMKEYITV